MTLVRMIRKAVTGVYQPRGNVCDGDCVVMDAFGYGLDRHGRPTVGRSNEQLANFVCTLPACLPVIAPAEPAKRLSATTSKRVWTIGTMGERHHARQVLQTAVDIMRGQGLSRPILVTSAYELPRCDMVLQKLGYAAILPAGLKQSVDFDPQSAQRWTRSRAAWARREPLVIIYFRLRGWI